MKDLAIDSRMFLDDEIDLAIQEIDLIMNTMPTELIGDTGFGVELEPFLWTLTPTTTELQNYITDKINTFGFYCRKYIINVKCTFMKGEYRSIYLVEITLNNEDTQLASKKYQFQ